MSQTNAQLNASFSPGRRWWALFVLTLVYLVNYIDRTVIYILQEPIKHEFGLQDWQLGLLGGAAFGIFYSICGVPIARLAESRNRVNIIMIAMIVWSGMTALCGAAQNFVQLLCIRVGVAVGEAGGTPPSHSIIADYFPPNRRATALSVFVLAVPAGQMLGALMGGSLSENFGWRMAFVVVALPGIALALLLRFTVPEPLRPVKSEVATPSGDDADAAPSFKAVIAHARHQKPYLYVLAGSTLVGFAGYALIGFTAAFFMRKFELELTSAGAAYAVIFGLASAIGSLSGGFLTDRLGDRNPRFYGWVPAIAMAASCPFFIWGYSQPNWQAAVIILAIPGILSTMHLGATYSVMHNSFEPRMRATITAITFLAHSFIGLSFGPLLLGFLSDRFAAASYDGAFAADCLGGKGSAGFDTACRVASAAGLQEAMILMSFAYVVGALFYFLAGRTLSGAPKNETGKPAI